MVKEKKYPRKYMRYRANPPWPTAMKFWYIATPVWNSWRMWKRCLGQFYEHVWLCENWGSGQRSMNEVTYLECRMRSGQIDRNWLHWSHLTNTRWWLLEDVIPSHGKYLLPNYLRPKLKDQCVFPVWDDTNMITDHNALLGMFHYLWCEYQTMLEVSSL